MEPSRAVLHYDFKDGFGVFSEPFGAEDDDSAMCNSRLMEFKRRDTAHLLPIFMAVRSVQEQIFDRVNAQPGQLGGTLRANPEKSAHRAR
jgi:hypothetical protein